MPWQSTTGPAIARGRSHFNEEEIRALVAYVGYAADAYTGGQALAGTREFNRVRAWPEAIRELESPCRGEDHSPSPRGGSPEDTKGKLHCLIDGDRPLFRGASRVSRW
jgi:hypothetical protein